MAARAAASYTAWRMYWPEQGLWNPCLSQLPGHLAEHEIVKAAWQGLDARRVWDCHSHLIGTGDSGSGIVVHPGTESLLDPAQYARRLFFMNAGCVHEAPASVDRAYVERMHNLLDGMRPGVKLLLFAFERAHSEAGAALPERSMFYVPDSYARDMARTHAKYFEWAASIQQCSMWGPKVGPSGYLWPADFVEVGSYTLHKTGGVMFNLNQ